jgi:diacylglycerol O-acyltransferase / wax synthase
VRVKVPVSLHHRAESAEAANRDSFFVVSLPLAEPDPVERLRRINAETALCRRAGDALVLDMLRADLGHVAPPLRRLVERLTGHPRAFALNVSNVPGPQQRPSGARRAGPSPLLDRGDPGTAWPARGRRLDGR